MATLLSKGDHEARFVVSQTLFLVEDKRLGAAGDTCLCPSVLLQMASFYTGQGGQGTERDLRNEASFPASPKKLVLSSVPHLDFV